MLPILNHRRISLGLEYSRTETVVKETGLG